MIFPVIFIGLLGGSISDNLAGALPAWFDTAITLGLSLVFVVVGTWLFVRADRNR